MISVPSYKAQLYFLDRFARKVGPGCRDQHVEGAMYPFFRILFLSASVPLSLVVGHQPWAASPSPIVPVTTPPPPGIYVGRVETITLTVAVIIDPDGTLHFRDGRLGARPLSGVQLSELTERPIQSDTVVVTSTGVHFVTQLGVIWDLRTNADGGLDGSESGILSKPFSYDVHLTTVEAQ
jgi:hypothetical protein